MGVTTTQRSLKLLRERGYTPWIVEHWNVYAHVKRDLYGFLDLVAIQADRPGVLGVQTTTASNLSARINKAEGLRAFRIWVASGNSVEFHGWKKVHGKWVADIRLFSVMS